MSTLPSVSVIVCSYTHEKWISRCIRSILNQKYVKTNDLEIILIDDNSTDNTQKILETFKDIDNLKIIKNKKNMGLPYSVNLGIKNAKSNYIVRLDSDDYVNKNFLYFLLEFIEGNKELTDAVSCDYLVVNDNEKVIKRENCLKNPIACGIIFKTAHLIDLGLYNENLRINEEVELRKRYEKKYKISRLNLPLYRYRRHQTNITNKFKKK